MGHMTMRRHFAIKRGGGVVHMFVERGRKMF